MTIRKIVISLAVAIGFFAPAFAFASTGIYITGYGTGSITVHSADGTTDHYGIYKSDGTKVVYTQIDGGGGQTQTYSASTLTGAGLGNGYIVYDPTYPNCNSGDMSSCIASGGISQAHWLVSGGVVNDASEVDGCTDSSANNYNPSANHDDGSCTYTISGCTDSGATNYNPSANSDDGSCTYPSPPPDGDGTASSSVDDMIASARAAFASTTGFSMDGAVAWSADNLKLFVGSGLALLFALRYWIAALAIIGAVIYFAYRAFRFFRH